MPNSRGRRRWWEKSKAEREREWRHQEAWNRRMELRQVVDRRAAQAFFDEKILPILSVVDVHEPDLDIRRAAILATFKPIDAAIQAGLSSRNLTYDQRTELVWVHQEWLVKNLYNDLNKRQQDI